MTAKTEYTALTALSVGRITTGKDGDRRADIVHRGEPVWLTDDEAAGFLNNHRVPVIKRKGGKGPDQVNAGDLSGPPPAPPAGVRPDPAGSTTVIQTGAPDPSLSPEGNEPKAEGTDPDTGAEGHPANARRGRPPRS